MVSTQWKGGAGFLSLHWDRVEMIVDQELMK
jgi:hypothetical protein